ncbi:uncharacterized protein A4U43_C10F250 [Asparagus officinalis]|uniref:Luc7-like protein 3 n=1 Tax=Asparagus officinalis TaxID=4686 RepID=A0A5P1DZI2_ASPOF|nr:uncharacterized protein A4U43_C10F250 [Asparagus officinalis]
MDAQRRALDELMGAARNLTEEEKKGFKEIRWDDKEVCGAFMVRFCPHDLFVNTKSDLGPCPRIHDLKLKERQQRNNRDLQGKRRQKSGESKEKRNTKIENGRGSGRGTETDMGNGDVVSGKDPGNGVAEGAEKEEEVLIGDTINTKTGGTGIETETETGIVEEAGPVLLLDTGTEGCQEARFGHIK